MEMYDRYTWVRIKRSLFIDRLYNAGWKEISPTERYWRFTKRNWICLIDWPTGTVSFERS